MRVEDRLFATENAAELSPCGVYRYTLTREWADGQCVAWLMFNPSTADASEDDATIRKCVGFSKRWGYGRMVVVNLYAVRNRDPKAVARTVDPVGPLNDYWTLEATREARELICAWGCGQHFPKDGRMKKALDLMAGKIKMSCLGKGKDGHPKHPLMLAYTTERETFGNQRAEREGI